MRAVRYDQEGLDVRELRNALGQFSTGVAVVTTRTPDGSIHGLTVNSFTAVSLAPPLVLWNLRLASPLLTAFRTSGQFAVNVLAGEQDRHCSQFAGPPDQRFSDCQLAIGEMDCPVIDGSLAWFECVTERVLEIGDHMMFVGEVKAAKYRAGVPLVFSGGKLATIETHAVSNAA